MTIASARHGAGTHLRPGDPRKNATEYPVRSCRHRKANEQAVARKTKLRADDHQPMADGETSGIHKDLYLAAKAIRVGATVSQGQIQNWWRQAMMGSASAHYQHIKVFSETDQTEDLKAIDVPIL